MSYQNRNIMTLKEKLEDKLLLMPLVGDPNKDEINNYHLSISKAAEVVDDCAIEFAEWLNDWCVKDKNNTSLENIYKHSLFDGYYTIKDLLEIFKKEQKWK